LEVLLQILLLASQGKLEKLTQDQVVLGVCLVVLVVGVAAARESTLNS
jgi:hypothetical protein